MDSYYFERSLIPENMAIGDKYIIFWENKTFKNLGYYLGKIQYKNKETFFCFGKTPDVSIADSRQISTFDLIFVFRKVYGTLQQDYPCDLYTSQTVDNTRLMICKSKNPFSSRDDLERL
jgi:hypothetical protein